MSVSCEYRNNLETLKCHFGCCEHGCCNQEQIQHRTLTPAEFFLMVGIPAAVAILLYIIKYYCRKQQIKTDSLQQENETSRPGSPITIHMESDFDQSQPPGGEHELPVAQGPPAYEERTNAPPSFEEATGLSPGPGIPMRRHSGYRKFENR